MPRVPHVSGHAMGAGWRAAGSGWRTMAVGGRAVAALSLLGAPLAAQHEAPAGRVVLAEQLAVAPLDAPAGGQGLNIGVQDAVNLGWKLAQVVRGISADSLLDTYEAERHPIARRVRCRILPR